MIFIFIAVAVSAYAKPAKKTYFDDGSGYEITHYHDNGKTKLKKVYGKSGKISTKQTFYKDGSRDTLTLYHKNGKPSFLNKNNEDGSFAFLKEFYKTGVLKNEVYPGVSTEYRKDGSEKEYTRYYVSKYFEAGQIKERKMKIEKIIFYRNGNTKEKNVYSRGVLSHIFFYRKDGTERKMQTPSISIYFKRDGMNRCTPPTKKCVANDPL